MSSKLLLGLQNSIWCINSSVLIFFDMKIPRNQEYFPTNRGMNVQPFIPDSWFSGIFQLEINSIEGQSGFVWEKETFKKKSESKSTLDKYIGKYVDSKRSQVAKRINITESKSCSWLKISQPLFNYNSYPFSMSVKRRQ